MFSRVIWNKIIVKTIRSWKILSRRFTYNVISTVTIVYTYFYSLAFSIHSHGTTKILEESPSNEQSEVWIPNHKSRKISRGYQTRKQERRPPSMSDGTNQSRLRGSDWEKIADHFRASSENVGDIKKASKGPSKTESSSKCSDPTWLRSHRKQTSNFIQRNERIRAGNFRASSGNGGHKKNRKWNPQDWRGLLKVSPKVQGFLE